MAGSFPSGLLCALSTCYPALLFLMLNFFARHHSHVTGVDFESKSLRCREVFKGTEHDVDYDYLVIATGAQNNTFGIPGVSEV